MCGLECVGYIIWSKIYWMLLYIMGWERQKKLLSPHPSLLNSRGERVSTRIVNQGQLRQVITVNQSNSL